MSDYRTLKTIDLSIKRAVFTGKTVHYRGGGELPKPLSLCIAQFDGDPGFYLLYFDAEGNELTDTYHDSIDAALKQAEWEFEISPSQWSDGPMK